MLDLAVFLKAATFGGRNADKVVNGTNGHHDEGRLLATTGQLTAAGKAAAKLDNILGKSAQAAIDVMCKTSQHNKALDYAVKGANWASKHVNPLLVGAAGYRVLVADKKDEALKKEICGMSAMFGTEALMKEFLNSNYLKNVHANMNNKYAKAALAVIEGLGFVAGSIAGSNVGYKVGEFYVNQTNGKKIEPKMADKQISEEIKRPDSLTNNAEKSEEAVSDDELGSVLVRKDVIA